MDAHVFMGGTFDPVHHGHLRTALEIGDWLAVGKVWLMPCKQPVHRSEPGSSSLHRRAMLDLAVADEPRLGCDPRELESEQPSYTIYTLQQLRRELGEQKPICMVIGMDAFLSLPSWYRWQEYFSLCHIVVVARPGYTLTPDETLARLLGQRQTFDKGVLTAQPAGYIHVHQLTPLQISATQIRDLIRAGHSARYLVPDVVGRYIQQQHLYRWSE